MRVVHCTPNAPRNPYYTVLRPYLSEFGIDIRYTADRDEIGDLLRSGWAEVFHIHQLEPFYRAADAGTTEKRAIDFAEWLRQQRRGGGRLVHTVHNRRPHDGLYPDVDRHLVGAILGVANQVVVLGGAAKAHVETIRPHGEIRVVPHPSLIGAHGPRAPRREARAALSIAPDEWIVLSLGRLMPYKGHMIIIDAFERAQLPASRLVIVGSGHADKEYTAVLEERLLALGSTRHRLGIGLLPDEEVQLWLGAADVSVFAFEELLMSTSVMLSLSYGVPVVVPDVGCLPEYVHEERNGFLFEPGDADWLARALHRAHSYRIEPGQVIGSIGHLSPPRIARDMAGVNGVGRLVSGSSSAAEPPLHLPHPLSPQTRAFPGWPSLSDP